MLEKIHLLLQNFKAFTLIKFSIFFQFLNDTNCVLILQN